MDYAFALSIVWLIIALAFMITGFVKKDLSYLWGTVAFGSVLGVTTLFF